MCIRDSYGAQASDGDNFTNDSGNCRDLLIEKILPLVRYFCLLYTSDAADERSSVDLGGRRIIKKT